MHKITVKDFPHLDFGDVRRDQRFVALIDSISQQPGSSIPKQSSSWYDTKAAYNFFKSPDVTVDALKKTIGAYGVAQVKDLSQLLVVHDISNISFNNAAVEGLGYLDHAKGNGILSYNSIAVSIDGLPLALMYQHTWTRPWEQVGKSKLKKQLAFEDKESYRWYDGMQSVNTSLGDKVHKIHIADRQADVYELFFNAYEQQTDLLIRAYTNRKLSEGGHLWDNIAKQEVCSMITLSIPDASGKKKQEIEASVRYQQVEILRPSTSKDKYESVELTAIEVKQWGDVNNEADRVCWKLLTTLKIESVTDVLQCIKWYTYRWLIERFHYVLKSGTKVENLQLKQATSLQKAISVYSLAAFRIMQLVYQARQYPEANCEVILTSAQWRTLYMLINKTKNVPDQPPCLAQAVMWIGRLGGHLGRKSDGPPGLKTVWLGYQKLCNAAEIYELTNLGNE